MAHQNIGFDLLKRVEEDLDGRGSVEQAPLSEGRQLVMLLSPAKTKKIMPKIKVHRVSRNGLKTGSGLKRKQANKRHILTKMSTKSKRQLRGTTSLADGDEKLVKRMFRERS